MKSFIAFLLLTSTALAHNPCGVNCNSTYVTTQYAVPVAVPVAVVYPALYSVGGVNPYAPVAEAKPAISSTGEKILAALERINAKLDGAPVAGGARAAAAPVGQSAVNDACAKCHNPAKKAGGLDLSNLAAVSDEMKLKAVAAIVSGEMPKGKPLSDPNIAGKLIVELSGGKSQPPTPSAASPTE